MATKRTQHPYQAKEYVAEVPLNWAEPSGPKIDVFARLLWKPGNEKKDICVFLQGGPGYESPRDPLAYEYTAAVLQKFRLLYLDQRGTGRSTKLDPSLIEGIPGDQLADYLAHFRSDSIVRDLEHLRERVLKSGPWYLLGQSYGGFVSFTYLSQRPDGLKGVMITGGVPPLLSGSVKAIFKTIVANVYRRNQEFYRAYPKEKEKVRRILALLEERPYRLDEGNFLTADRFRFNGLGILGSNRPLEQMHYFLDDPFTDRSQKKLSLAFARGAAQCSAAFELHPFYTLFQEPIYASGSASGWAAAAAMDEHGGFDALPSFFGETFRPNLYEQVPGLRPYRAAAQQLADKKWPEIWNLDQLAKNQVPVECLVYRSDYYVDCAASLKTVKSTRLARATVHPTWQHDALRVNGTKVMATLIPRLMARVRRNG